MSEKIIMDCDPGHDDAIAMILAGARTSHLEILAVTTVSGNQAVSKNTRNALNVLDIMGKGEIPVSMGASRPLIKEPSFAEEIHGVTGLDGPKLPETPRHHATPHHAADVIID